MSVADNPGVEQCQYCGLPIARNVEKYLGIIPYKINTDEYVDFIISHNFNKNFSLIRNFNKDIFNKIIRNYKEYQIKNFSNYEDFRYIKKRACGAV